MLNIMSHYKETIDYTQNSDLEVQSKSLFSDWNTKTNIVTVWDSLGRVVYSGTDSEAKALSILLSSVKCRKIDKIPHED